MRLVPFAALLLLAAAGSQAGAQTLRIAMNNDPDLLDPTTSRTFVGTNVMTGLCDKLVDLDAKLNIVPRLATAWEYPDSRTILIHLRPGVLFQDGEKMDAAAVKYTLDRHLTFPGSFRRAELAAADHIEVVDPLTVRVVLKQPSSPWLAQLTDRSGMMVSPKAAGAAGKDFGNHPVCAGPFSFAERVAQDHITLDRFPGYWDRANVHFDRVIYRVMTDSSIRLSNLRAGAVELADIVPTDVEQVKADPRLRLSTASGLGYTGLTINVGANPRAETPLGRDARVRQALSLAIDREALIQVVFAGQYTANAQPVAPDHPLHDAATRPPGRDVARARALLAEAGVKTPLAVKLMIPNSPQGVQVGEVVQSMAAEIGIMIQPVVMDFGTTLAASQKGDFEAYYIGWSGLLDADSNVWSFLHTGGSLNTAGYSNARVDALLDQARETADVAARRALYAQVWQQEGQDLPIIYLWTPRYIVGHVAKLTGFQTMPDGLMRLQGVKLAP
jgi:peptide/nickel transport system substrate-binding protein